MANDERAAVPDGWLAIRGAPHALRRHDVIATLAAQGLHVVTDADWRDYEESLVLWKHWSENDITADEDFWVAFSDRVHALLARREAKP